MVPLLHGFFVRGEDPFHSFESQGDVLVACVTGERKPHARTRWIMAAQGSQYV